MHRPAHEPGLRIEGPRTAARRLSCAPAPSAAWHPPACSSLPPAGGPTAAVRGGRRLALIAGVLGCGLAAALSPPETALAAPEPGGEGWVFDVEVAPLVLDGTYPVSVQSTSGPLVGEAALTTDTRGKIVGTLTLDGAEYAVKGKIKFKGATTSLKLTAKLGRKDSVTLKGSLSSGSFTGDAKGKGALKGTTTFALDATSATGAVASITSVVYDKPRKRIKGSGTALVGGVEYPIKVAGRSGASFKIKFRGGKRNSLSITGVGTHEPGGAVLDFATKGFGATGTPPTMVLDTVLPPSSVTYSDPASLYETEDLIAPNVATVPGDNVDTWSIDPQLPSGLSIDVQTGAITGTPLDVTPQADYTVTAANLAGATTVDVSIEVRQNRAYSVAPQASLDANDIRHFLERTQWGVDDADLVEIQTNGLESFIDDMLDLQLGQPWELAATDSELKDSNDPDGIVPSTTQIARWWVEIMAKSEQPFQEVLAFFWHDHLAVGSQDLSNRANSFMIPYINLLREKGAGNFKDLMLDVSRDAAMLRYLDSISNRAGAPNENYAREFWELFTLGVDNGYTQDDIVESARAFTGWRERSQSIVDYPVPGQNTTTYYVEFQTSRHDTGDKTFFGQTIPGQNVTDDFEAVVDITFDQRNPEHFIARKLVEWFAMEDPPQELVDQLATQFRNDAFEIAPLLKTLFTSEAFYSSRARGTFVKNPLEFGIGLVRTTGLHVRPSTMDSMLNGLGMRPSQPPVVDGWPSGGSWLSAQAMVDRSNLTALVVNDISYQNGQGIDVADLLPPPGERSAAEVIDALAAKMQVELSPEDRQDLIDYMVTERLPDGSTVLSPFDPNNSSHVNERVRGAIYVMAAHPTYPPALRGVRTCATLIRRTPAAPAQPNP